MNRAIKLISPFATCLVLSACATDYASQLSEPNYGMHVMQYSEHDIDPTMLMNGEYASKQSNGLNVSGSLGAFCLSSYRCSQQTQLWSSGSAP